MTKNELSDVVATRTGLPRKTATAAVDAVFGVIIEALTAKEDVRVPGFGAFATKTRAAMQGRNPRTGEPMDIAAAVRVNFTVAKALKDAVAA